MSTSQPLPLSGAAQETVLPEVDPGWSAAREDALSQQGEARHQALRALAGAHPRFLDAWADLADEAAGKGDHVTAYAYARVGYHRGLDALRGAGWRGSGYVYARHRSNQGFLRSLDALRAAAAAIGEQDEEERCAIFLGQLDPSLRREQGPAAESAPG